MKIFLDDVRSPKHIVESDEWVIARNYQEFQEVCLEHKDNITAISFDHDLGEEHSGMDCAKWLVEMVLNGKIDICSTLISIHSANPVGAENIRSYFKSFYKSFYGYHFGGVQDE